MSTLDFPTSPIVGQLYPQPAVPGQPVYTWDGEKWTTNGGSVVSAVPGSALPLGDTTPAVVGVATKYSREDHRHPIDLNSVRVDVGQALTAGQQQQGRQNIYAAPFDAMAYSGMQINGGMEVSQENGAASVSVPTGVKYIVDGWNIASAGAHVLSCTQRVDLNLAGLNSGLQLAVTTANPTPAAADYCTLRQFIEGYRIKRLAWGTAAAQPITLGFWLIANRTGLYSGCVRNGAANRGYIFTFNYTTSGAWQYFTVTIPGDTAGTWATDNTIGLAVHFSIMSGSNNQGAAGAWSSTVQLGATGTVNAVAATSDYFIITGVTVLPGSEVPSAARSPLIMRPYDQELVLCQRYCRWVPFSIYSMAYQPEQIAIPLPFSPMMRAAPTLSAITIDPALSGPAAIVNAASATYSLTTVSNTVMFMTALAAGGTYVYGYRSFADARM
jgi:hypothetical protein